jgi:hypothetical protein
LVQGSLSDRVLQIDSSRRVLWLVPKTVSDIALFLAFAGTAIALLVLGHTSGPGVLGILAYGGIAFLFGVALLPSNQCLVTIDLLARHVAVEGPYGNGRGTETRFEDLTFQREDGVRRRKYGRMAPWTQLRAVAHAGTPDERILFTTGASDAPLAIAAVHELARVLDAARRDPAAGRELDLTALEQRVSEVGAGGAVVGTLAAAMVLLPGVLACLGHLR